MPPENTFLAIALGAVTKLVSPVEFSYFLRVLLGGALGLCLGVERSRRQKEAGMSTHLIVACAAALLTCVSLWFKKDAGDMGDGARIAAQIVSGVGFLGAGMIFFRRESMRGLTTAAGIWATAAIGMCVGTGMYLLAIGTTAAIILFQLLNHSKLFKRNSIHLLLVKLEYNDEIQKKLMEFFGCHNFHRFKITSVGSGEKAGQPDGKKKVVAEAVIYPTEHCSADAIAHFVLDTPEIMSIERLEDL